METKDDKHKFFGREHLIRAGWVIVIGLAGFVGSALYHKFVSPQKLVIDYQKQQPIPVVIREIGRENQGQYSEEIKSLTVEVKKLRDAYSKKQNETSKNIPLQTKNASHIPQESEPKPITPDVRELSEEVRRLRESLAKGKTSTIEPQKEVNVSSAYRLPPSVKGHVQDSPRGIVSSNCPPPIVKSGEQISIGFTVKDRGLLTRATPLFTRIIKKRAKNNLLQVFEQVNELKGGYNSLKFSVKLEPGSYYVEYGYYLRAELGKEYPSFYSRQCDFKVSE